MPSHHQITFVKKDLKKPVTHQVTHVGGILADGTPWTIPVRDAISGITSGRFVFTIPHHRDKNEDGDAGEDSTELLIVAHSAVHGAFLRAETDEREPKSLMMLPEPDVNEENYY